MMGMHFKLGLYEHQSAGAIQGVIDLIAAEPKLLDDPGPAARHADPHLRAGVQHHRRPGTSAIRRRGRAPTTRWSTSWPRCCARRTKRDAGGWDGQDGWRRLMLAPADYAEDESALFHPLTRRLMQQIDFRHGGPEFDRKYPDGIPTTVEFAHAKLGPLTSGLVMYPAGHARCESENLVELLERKVRLLAEQGVEDVESFLARFTNVAAKSAEEIRRLYDFQIRGVAE